MAAAVLVQVGDALARYRFPAGHPFSIDRQGAFWDEAHRRGLQRHCVVGVPRLATREELLRFHTAGYVDWVRAGSARGDGYLDYGDTPVFPGILESASAIAGTAVAGLDQLMAGSARRVFQPVGGLHHARRDAAAGFCVFNDLAIVVQTLRQRYGVRRIAYVDIDVHHGDGVYYAFEGDPDLVFADVHEDGRYLYPGTGDVTETGTGKAQGTKLNLPLLPGAGDDEFIAAWERVLGHLRRHRPEFVLFQCGVDSLRGDPLGHLKYTPFAHTHATTTLCALADEFCQGRLMAFGGGGYSLENCASGWCAVLDALVSAG